METTRHFTATVYIVNAGKTALHKHPSLDMWLPPGGHIDRDELPHDAAIREAYEETGLHVELLHDCEGPSSDTARPIPQPATLLLEDIAVAGDHVVHQHIDFIYFGTVKSRTIAPAKSEEVEPNSWQWFSPAELKQSTQFDEDVVSHGIQDIDQAKDK